VFSGFNETITGLTFGSHSPKFNNLGDNTYLLDSATNSIILNFSGVSPHNSQATLVLNITTPAGATANDVPEPATAALLGLGLLGVAASRRVAGAGRIRPNIPLRLRRDKYAAAMRLLMDRPAIARVVLMTQ